MKLKILADFSLMF